MIKKLLDYLVKRKAKKICFASKDYLGKIVLDLGAGRCYIAKEIMKRKKCKVTCIDVQDLNETDLKLKVYDGKKIPYKDNYFESVIIAYVLHHCDDPMAVLKEARRVCKGNIIIFEDIDGRLTRVCDYIVNRLHRVDTPFNFKSEKEWKSIFKKLSLKLIDEKKGVEKEWYYPVEHVIYVLEK